MVLLHVDSRHLSGYPADPLPQGKWPTKFKLVISLKTTKKLGLTFSPELLFQADRLIR